jgi:hypothetical protein
MRRCPRKPAVGNGGGGGGGPRDGGYRDRLGLEAAAQHLRDALRQAFGAEAGGGGDDTHPLLGTKAQIASREGKVSRGAVYVIASSQDI